MNTQALGIYKLCLKAKLFTANKHLVNTINIQLKAIHMYFFKKYLLSYQKSIEFPTLQCKEALK